jgi:hypothetical protein
VNIIFDTADSAVVTAFLIFINAPTATGKSAVDPAGNDGANGGSSTST